eukprot:365998-Chlamydomonas_euryale.AAC.8
MRGCALRADAELRAKMCGCSEPITLFGLTADADAALGALRDGVALFLSGTMVSLKLQKRLAASVLGCGQRKVRLAGRSSRVRSSCIAPLGQRTDERLGRCQCAADLA